MSQSCRAPVSIVTTPSMSDARTLWRCRVSKSGYFERQTKLLETGRRATARRVTVEVSAKLSPDSKWLVLLYMASIYGPMTYCFVASLKSWRLWRGAVLSRVLPVSSSYIMLMRIACFSFFFRRHKFQSEKLREGSLLENLRFIQGYFVIKKN